MVDSPWQCMEDGCNFVCTQILGQLMSKRMGFQYRPWPIVLDNALRSFYYLGFMQILRTAYMQTDGFSLWTMGYVLMTIEANPKTSFCLTPFSVCCSVQHSFKGSCSKNKV